MDAIKFEGLFIRDTLNDEGYIPSGTENPTYSPDVICYGDDILSAKDAAISYHRNICKAFVQGSVNNIYIRVCNNGSENLQGKVKAYYAPLNMLYNPPKWTPIYTDKGVSEVDVVSFDADSGVNAGDVGLCEHAFSLSTLKDPTAHHCIMGMVSDSDGKFIDLPNSFSSNNALWLFLKQYPQIAYNNIHIIIPTYHTYEFPVEYGNHDDASRTFVLNLDIQDGLDTLKNAELLIQSTNARNPFSFKYIVDESINTYSCTYTLPGNYQDYLDFAIVMPHYEATKATIHVKNYAVNTDGDNMSADVRVKYDWDDSDDAEQSATMLGDFFICLGQNMDEVVPSSRRSTLSTELPLLQVTKRA